MIFSFLLIPILQTQRFLRVEPTPASGARPGRAGPTAPDPARDYIRITGRSLTQPSRFQSHRPSAEPGPPDSISQAVCPAWPVPYSGSFRFCLRAVAPPPRTLETITCSLDRAQRCLWGSRPLSTSGARSRVCHGPIPARIPLVRVGSVVP